MNTEILTSILSKKLEKQCGGIHSDSTLLNIYSIYPNAAANGRPALAGEYRPYPNSSGYSAITTLQAWKPNRTSSLTARTTMSKLGDLNTYAQPYIRERKRYLWERFTNAV